MNRKEYTIHPVTGENLRVTILKNILQQTEGKTLVDLGAGHCQYSILAHKAGFNVTAVDARTVRVPADLPFDIKFIRANALDFDVSSFDVICILGLLYHLAPDEQIALLKKCAGKTAIIDTHLADTGSVKLKGYQGKYYREAKDTNQMMKNPKASVTTLNSFWHTYSSFYRMLENTGFNEVTTIKPEHYPFRTFFICK
jgi:SAM-dependent methyltransferase